MPSISLALNQDEGDRVVGVQLPFRAVPLWRGMLQFWASDGAVAVGFNPQQSVPGKEARQCHRKAGAWLGSIPGGTTRKAPLEGGVRRRPLIRGLSLAIGGCTVRYFRKIRGVLDPLWGVVLALNRPK